MIYKIDKNIISQNFRK